MSTTVLEVEDGSFNLETLAALPPLPDEKYPRIVERGNPDRGYYVALGLVLSVWMITPLSCAYLLWYTLFAMTNRAGLTSTIFAAYAMTEILFAIHMSNLIRYVQTPAPPSTLPLEARNALFRRVLRSDLSYPIPARPVFKSTDSDPGGVKAKVLWGRYEAGELTKEEYWHMKDGVYEAMHGMREGKRRVGKMTEGEKRVIDEFVEESPGERDKRLRREIEGDVGEGFDDFPVEGLYDREGELIQLHPMDRRAVEFRERLRTWFNHAAWADLKRENILIWLSFACFNMSYEETKAKESWRGFLEESVEMLEARTGTKFEEGYNPKLEIMRLTLDPVNAKGRPLILYALSNITNWWLRAIVYPYQGLALYTEGDMEYLIRIPPGWTSEKGMTQANSIPVVYLHGLGFGLLQSHLLIKHLIKSLPSHPLLIPLSPYTAQSLFSSRHLRPWSREETVGAMKEICKKWGFWEESRSGRGRGGVSLLSHSNGSIAHGWIMKDCPSLARRSCFVDPIPFLLWEGDVCHNFCYRKPSTALELLLYYFIASEVGIANYIQRHFDWAENTLFVDEIPNINDHTKTAFFLGGQDIIIDATRVRRYLEKHGVGNGIHWDANAGHGDGLSGEARDRVVKFVGTGSTQGWQNWRSGGVESHIKDKGLWVGSKRGVVKDDGSGSESDKTLVDGKALENKKNV